MVIVASCAPRGGALHVECSSCGLRTPDWHFGIAPGYDRPPVLPPLEDVRRRAVSTWNSRAGYSCPCQTGENGHG